MKNGMRKITLTLAMLLVMAVPAQAFAAQQCDVQTAASKSGNVTVIYNQIKEQIDKAGNPARYLERYNQAPQAKQTPAQETRQAVPTKQTPAKNTTTTTPVRNENTSGNTATPASNNETKTPAAAIIGDFEQQVVDLVNKERAAAGLPALKVNARLAAVAEKKAEDLRDNHYFDHN